MNKYLKESVKKDKREIEKIMPISKGDAEIFQEIIEALKKLNQKSLVDILEKYKKSSDEDIANLLLSWNTEFNSEVQEGGYLDEDGEFIVGDKKQRQIKKVFINIGDEYLDGYQIFRIKKRDQYSHKHSMRVYQITINEQFDEKWAVKNIVLEFLSPAARDSSFKKLKDQLLELGVRFNVD